MPYRIPFKPKQRPVWDKCRCRWVSSLTFELKNNGRWEAPYAARWVCCWCSEYKIVSISILPDVLFCPECGHARNLRAGEQEENWNKIFSKTTHSSGPR